MTIKNINSKILLEYKKYEAYFPMSKGMKWEYSVQIWLLYMVLLKAKV